ncbi:MAG: phage integrase N-terminal SAM-like domain-containing protein [Betaproteobacteria bacterium]|nr:phage integrase N-terminal SAM-like domain-containing protein [Betaproteobacteria bacterium]
MNSIQNPPDAPAPPLRSVRLLDQVRERVRYKHYSIRTEQQYVYWVRAFVRFSGLRHPRELGAPDVERKRPTAPPTRARCLPVSSKSGSDPVSRTRTAS